MLIRPATVSDATGLARVHVAAWRAAYVGIMPDAYLAELDEARFERGWVRALEEGVNTTLVGVVDGVVQGFATVGAATDDDAPAHGQLLILNLHPVAIGSGLAAELHAAALAQVARDGHAAAYLWVADRNPRARRFYEREGWVSDGGSRIEEFGGSPLPEVRYVRGIP